MFPFIASQAVALTQGKQLSRQRTAPDAAPNPQKRTIAKGLLSRVFAGIAQSRLRKAQLEVDVHRRMLGMDSRQ